MKCGAKSLSAVLLIVLCLIMSAQQSCKRSADNRKGLSDTCICYIYDDVHDIVISGDDVFGQRLQWGSLAPDYSHREFFLTTMPADLSADLKHWASAEGDAKTLLPEESAVFIDTIDNAPGGIGHTAIFRPQNDKLKQWLSSLEQAVFTDANRVTAVPDWVQASKITLGRLGMTGGDAGTPQPTDTQLVKRAVYLWFMQRVPVDQRSKALFFLTLDRDEERDLDKTYEGFRVLSASECVMEEKKGVRSKATGESGVILEAKRIQMQGTSAVADVWTIPGSTSAAICKFTLEKTDGVWRITSATLAGTA